jgi:hypothetical protein
VVKRYEEIEKLKIKKDQSVAFTAEYIPADMMVIPLNESNLVDI